MAERPGAPLKLVSNLERSRPYEAPDGEKMAAFFSGEIRSVSKRQDYNIGKQQSLKCTVHKHERQCNMSARLVEQPQLPIRESTRAPRCKIAFAIFSESCVASKVAIRNFSPSVKSWASFRLFRASSSLSFWSEVVDKTQAYIKA